MSFLNPFILLGALGIGLPILAHLLNRLQVQRTDWAAMQFLNRSVRVRSRQLRLRDVLLLILRCLALLLLIFAIARPAWKGDSASWIPGEKRAGVVIAVDSSFSMQHGEKGSSRFDLALKQVATISGKIEAGDPVTLVLLGGDEKLIAHNMI
ncbi:MAG: BatA domain-containing protein, partial [Akkermansiaceae bacterium]